MKQLYSARNGLEAHDLRFFLAAHGIEAKVFGDNNSFESIFAFTPASAPGVYVHDTDHNRAVELLDQFLVQSASRSTTSKWTCETCGQVVEGQFDACWSCESPRDDVENVSIAFPRAEDVPIELTHSKAETQSGHRATGVTIDQGFKPNRRELWLEVLVVLSVAWFPYFAYGLAIYCGADITSDSFILDSTWSIIESISIIVVVLYIIYRSHEPWSRFGVRRPRFVLDLAMGFIIWLMTVAAVTTLRILGTIIYGSSDLLDLGQSSFEFIQPKTVVDFCFVVLLSLAIGVSEELAMRGYLIPRLEQLLNSTPKSVLISSLVFASYHLYQGVGPTLWIFIVGLSFGVAFCLVRRLWPLAAAHAIMDVIALTTGP